MLAKNSFDLYFPRVPFREYMDGTSWFVQTRAAPNVFTTNYRARYRTRENIVFILDRIVLRASYRFGILNGVRRAQLIIKIFTPEQEPENFLYSYVGLGGLDQYVDLGILFHPNSSFSFHFESSGTMGDLGPPADPGCNTRFNYFIVGRYFNNMDLPQDERYPHGLPDRQGGVFTRNQWIPT